MRAAVLHEIGQDKLEVLDDVDAVGFGPGRVRIRVRATGLCHSDLSAMGGVLPQPAPFVPGHEGAGEILEVGEGVTGVKPGDRVVVCWLPACGACPACKRGQTELCLAGFMNAGTPNFRRPGGDLFGFAGTGTFAEEVVVDAGCAVPIPDDVPFDIAALIGCGVTTGLGAALNTADVEAGSSVAVIGCGGVGISAIQGARLKGAAEIVAVDPVASSPGGRLKFGATKAVSPEELPGAKQLVTGERGSTTSSRSSAAPPPPAPRTRTPGAAAPWSSSARARWTTTCNSTCSSCSSTRSGSCPRCTAAGTSCAPTSGRSPCGGPAGSTCRA